MIGAYITFVVVLVIVTVYMLIVHSFLRSAVDPQDEMREQSLKKKPTEPPNASSGLTEYAH